MNPQLTKTGFTTLYICLHFLMSAWRKKQKGFVCLQNRVGSSPEPGGRQRLSSWSLYVANVTGRCAWSSARGRPGVRSRSMGTTEAFLTAAFLTVCFIGTAGVLMWFWMKYTARHDEEVMLDCARKAGGPAAVRAIQKQLQLDRGGPHTASE
jgi:hypothetical protein